MTDWQKQIEEQRQARLKVLSEDKVIALEKWKEHNVDYVNFIFDCGGDSMGDTSIEIYDKEGELIEVPEIENYIDNAIYDNVDFYVNSDGVYMGENGVVLITLDEDEEDEFNYVKDSEEEWSEHTPFTEKIQLTDEEVEFIDKYVDNFNGNMGEGDYNVNYKADFVQTDELVAVEEALMKKLQDYFENYEPNLENLSDWHTMEVNDTTLDKENKTIDIEMSFNHYVYRSGDN